MCITEINGIALYKSEIFSGYKNLVHGFTTRKGGVSEGAYESLSMSPRRGDDILCVRKNEEILCNALSLELSNLTSTRQEHTDVVRVIKEEDIGIGVSRPWDEGVDGVITMLEDVPLLCYSADCVPILFYADDIKAIGAVHSGWRGTQMKIAQKAVEKLKELGGKAENIKAAIGPCIGKCCYEVSDDVALRFLKECRTEKPDGKFMLDLSYTNRIILEDSGVLKENISESGICTKCRNDLFFSHRGQGGKSGTLGGIICMQSHRKVSERNVL